MVKARKRNRKHTEALEKAGIYFLCPKCSSGHTVGHGFNVTKAGKFARQKCQECGTTFYKNKDVASKEKEGKEE